MLSRQVNEIVDVVFVIENLGKVRSPKHNLTVLTASEKIKMLKTIHYFIYSTFTVITLLRCLIWKFIKVTDYKS